MPKAIIFGSNGQDGYYLRQLLPEKKVDLIGVSRSEPADIIGDVETVIWFKRLFKRISQITSFI
ncbi:MAG: hypothetical protein QM734_01280 [Cyclobacteriaceae bacterium]